MTALAAVWGEALRLLRARPLGNAAVVLVLALGLVAVMCVSAISALVMDAAPDAIPGERLFGFGVGAHPAQARSLPGSEALALRLDVAGLERTVLLRGVEFNLAAADGDDVRSERVSGTLIDGDPFALLGWPMAMGRGFSAEDFAADAPAVVVIGDALWRSRFNADPSVIGRSLRIDGAPAVLVGVLPPQRAYPFQQQIYRPVNLAASPGLHSRYWQTLVRVDEPSALPAIRAAFAAAQTERERLQGAAAKHESLHFSPLWGASSGPQTELLVLVLAAVVGLVMLMAATNAGGLLLVQWLGRARELATRRALGAGALRIGAGLLLQGLLLVGLAWLLALLLSDRILDALSRYFWSVESGMPLYVELQLSAQVLAISAAAALLAVLLLTVPTLLRLRGAGALAELRSGTRSTSRMLSRFSRGLFALQALLAVVTVLATLQAGLGAHAQQTQSIGLDTDAVLVAQFNGADLDARAAFSERLQQRLRAEPGVGAVSVSNHIPLAVVSRPDLALGERLINVDLAPVDVGFAEVYGLPLRRGRWFSEDEVAQQRRVAVIDPALAAALFEGRDGIGESFTRDVGGESVRYQVIGLTEEVRLADAVGADRPSVFVPMPPRSGAELALALRLEGDVEAFVPRLQALAAGIDPDFALAEIGSFAERRARANEWAQMVLGMFAPLGVLALVLATTGLSALLGSLVNERIREIGLRRALGATGASLGRGLLGGLGLWGSAGSLLGVAAAIALVDPLSQSLYGESQVGAMAIGATLIALLLALAVGVAGPLGRALRLDPLTALRSD